LKNLAVIIVVHVSVCGSAEGQLKAR